MNRTTTLVASALALTALGGLAGFGLNTAELAEGSSSTTSSTAVSVASESAVSSRSSYAVDPVHTNVIFKIRHAGVSNFYGRFDQVNGTIDYDADNIANSSMSFKIPTSSVNTNNKNRDGHIQDAEFFNTRQYKDIVFESTSIKPGDEQGTYELSGELTLHGVTKEITADLREVRTGMFRDREVLGFEARFTILRSDFEIMKYLAADLSDDGPLGNSVEIIVAVEAGIE